MQGCVRTSPAHILRHLLGWMLAVIKVTDCSFNLLSPTAPVQESDLRLSQVKVSQTQSFKFLPKSLSTDAFTVSRTSHLISFAQILLNLEINTWGHFKVHQALQSLPRRIYWKLSSWQPTPSKQVWLESRGSHQFNDASHDLFVGGYFLFGDFF